MSGHTPGEWWVDHETRGGEICTVHSLPDSFGNGQGWAYIYGESRYPADGEQVANARLIAASPLLLAALKELVEVAAAHIPEAHGPHPNPAFEPIENARAAIAAAEGEPS